MRPRPSATATDTLRCDDRRTEHSSMTPSARPSRVKSALFGEGGNTGPRGPRMRAGHGAIALAKLSGVPILPVSYSASRCKIFQSWDRFFLPLPFAKGIFIWGEPIKISKQANKQEIELARQKLEEQLTQLSQSADTIVGQTTPEPEGGGTIL